VEGPSFGFGDDGTHLPQPAWFGKLSVEAQSQDQASTLSLYREALALRHDLQTAESMTWIPSDSDEVLHLRRPNGWEAVANFGEAAVPLPAGEVLLASGPIDNGELPAETTVWLRIES
jgi:alpha-glucosidase